jgi:hypothetical protein
MSKFVVNLTWEDAPHLTTEAKKELLASYSPHERDARSKGIPQLGSGAIYPLVEADITIDPFTINDKWPRACGMDVGWKKTAAIWGAYDQKTDTIYCYSEYYRGYAEPAIHADAIRARGAWVPIAVDCHSDRHSEAGAMALLQQYEKYGLNVCKANNGPGTVDPSILEVFQRLSSGRLKIMSHLMNTLAEFRVYRRDMNGKIVKQDDHLMDALRYLVMSILQIMEMPPPEFLEDSPDYQRSKPPKTGQSGVTGY